MNTRLLVAACGLLLCIPTLAQQSEPNLPEETTSIVSVSQITDLDENAAGYEQVRDLVERYGILDVREKNVFAPDEPITLAIFTIWMHKALNHLNELGSALHEELGDSAYELYIDPMMGHTSRGDSVMRKLLDGVKAPASKWYAPDVVTFCDRYVDKGTDDGDASEYMPDDEADESDESISANNDTTSEPKEVDISDTVSYGTLQNAIFQHFTYLPSFERVALMQSATRRAAAIALANAMNSRIESLEAKAAEVRMMPSKQLAEDMKKEHAIDLAESKDKPFDGTIPLTRRLAAKWLTQAYDKSTSYVTDAIRDASEPEVKERLAQLKLNNASSIDLPETFTGIGEVSDVSDAEDRELLNNLMNKGIYLIDKSDKGGFLFNANKEESPKQFERLLLALYKVEGSLDLDKESQYTAFDLGLRFKHLLDFHKNAVKEFAGTAESK